MSVAHAIENPILEVDGVTMRFGGLVANDCVSFQVKRGEVFALIGPNGAGKSTLFNAITGVHQATEGRVRFEGKEIRRDWSGTIFARMMLSGMVLAFWSRYPFAPPRCGKTSLSPIIFTTNIFQSRRRCPALDLVWQVLDSGDWRCQC